MLNKHLFDDPKDAEIARLKMTIEKFKEYDKERKAYYADKMQRLGELESFVAEIEAGDDNMKYTIVNQKNAIRRLNKLIQAYKINTRQNDDDINDVITLDNLKMQNKKLQQHIKMLKETISQLMTKTAKNGNNEEIAESVG